jgi:iron(III) transport system permease protein
MANAVGTKARSVSDALRAFRHQWRGDFRGGLTWWSISALIAVALTVLPLGTILLGMLGSGSEMWGHLAETVLLVYVGNSIVLMLGVGVLSLVIGLAPAWLVSVYDFPGRRTFEWALVLPLAIPTYIIAYTYAGIFEYDNLLPSALSTVWPGMEVWRIRSAVMSREGAMVMMALVLYPYVYVIARASFLRQSSTVLEMARTLGRGPGTRFFESLSQCRGQLWPAV